MSKQVIPNTYNVEFDKWELLEDVTIEVEADPNHLQTPFKIHVPAGYLWDKATIPWPARIFIAKEELSDVATLTHDILYGAWKGDLEVNMIDPPHLKITRKLADDVFYTKMEKKKIPWWKKWLAYIAVFLFGGGKR